MTNSGMNSDTSVCAKIVKNLSLYERKGHIYVLC